MDLEQVNVFARLCSLVLRHMMYINTWVKSPFGSQNLQLFYNFSPLTIICIFLAYKLLKACIYSPLVNLNPIILTKLSHKRCFFFNIYILLSRTNQVQLFTGLSKFDQIAFKTFDFRIDFKFALHFY